MRNKVDVPFSRVCSAFFHNADVGLRLDLERFFDLLIGDLARYP
jgi:hypothetical protein